MTVNIVNLVPVFLIIACLNACASNDRSILTMAGDEVLDCTALEAEMDSAVDLGEDAPARRRHIRSLQEQNQCISKPNISMSFGYTKFF
ncbi:hypothetical protein OAP51_06395 [Alphaproteobacteria bacterium]|nr:hypothetical protein [Alphaproteobacteria bacterium]